jgi:matrixin
VSFTRSLLALAITLAAARLADATLYVATSDRTLARRADTIVAGTVRSVTAVATADGRIATRVTIDVDTQLKGRRSATVVVDQPGGALDDRALWIEGAPQFRIGERQLLFLAERGDGTMRTVAFGLGQYHLHEREGRDTLAERSLGAPVVGGATIRRLHLSRLVRTIRRAVATASPAAPPPPASVMPRSPVTHQVSVEAFTLMDRPSGRWHQPDLGEPVVIDVDAAGDTGLGADASLAAVDAALGAWTQVSGATIVLARGPASEPMPMLCDGISQIVFNDPFGEIPNPGNCSGVLAIGGYCTAGKTEVDVIDGVQYRRITEGNITFSNGFAHCPFWTEANLAEITTHELGHTIGIGHSSELDDEPSAVLKDATMYYRAHFDGRAASVRPDDIAAVRALYPGGTEPPDDDLDRDGVTDAADNCPGSDPALGLANPAQSDLDHDGLGDVCDPCPLSADNTSCGQLLGSRVRARARGQGTLQWSAVVDTPLADAEDTLARVVLVSGDGVLLDSNGTAGGPGRGHGKAKGHAKAKRHKMKFRSPNATLFLGAVRPSGFRVRLRVRPFAAPTTPLSLVVVTLQVGEATYTAPLICRPSTKFALSCTN